MSNSSYYSQLFIGLSKPCHLRDAHDLDNIFLYLRNLEALRSMRDLAVRELARIARLEHHNPCEFLFQKGEVCSSWYILVSGAVLVDGTMFLPRSTFGTRSFGLYRHQNCQVLTDSDFIVVDYQDDEYATSFDRQPSFHVKQTLGGAVGPSFNGYVAPQSNSRARELAAHAAQITRTYELAGSESLPNYDLTGRTAQAWGGAHTECLPSELGSLAAGDSAWYPPPYGYAHGEFPPDPGPASGRPPLGNLPKGNRQSVASGASGSNARRSRTSSFSNNDDGMSINSASDHALYASQRGPVVLADSTRTVPYNPARDLVIAIGDEESASGSGAPQSVSDDDDDLPDDEDAVAPRERCAVPAAIRIILEKETTERTVEEVEVLLSFVQPLAAFARHPYDARRALCQRMVIAVVDKANTIVIQDGEELDAWSVLVSGSVEMQTPEGRRSLAIGDAFGAAADMTPQAAANAPVQRFRGYMRTLTNDCQFLCVARPDYQRTMSELLQNTVTETDDNGRVVLVKERRGMDGAGEAAAARGTCVIVRATVERLLCHLVEEHSPADASFVEDFLLTQRVFLDSPVRVFDKLFEWYRERVLRERVVRIVLLWLNAHFAEFERDATLMQCLENFERLLASDTLVGELALLRLACTSKARVRTIVLRRNAPHEEFQFSVIGGRDWHSPVFVSKCEHTSLAHQAGLRRGDQILEVNAVSFATFSHADAVRIFRSRSNDLRMRVRSNLLGFAQLVDNAARNNKPPTATGRQVSVDPTLQQGAAAQRQSFDLNAFIQSTPPARAPPVEIEITKPPSPSVMRRIAKMVRGGVSSAAPESDAETQPQAQSTVSSDATTRRSSSFRNDADANSDAASIPGSLAQVAAGTSGLIGATCALPEHVIRVYKSEQIFKYFLIHRETTANHVIESAVVEFALVEPGTNAASAYSLCEVSVETGGVIRQKRLPDSATNLADRLPLNARYFIKANDRTDPLVADSAALIGEVLKDTPNNLMQITAFEMARCVTIDDFDAFQAVQAHQYIVDLFELDKQQRNTTQAQLQSSSSMSQQASGTRDASATETGDELRRFAELIDTERFWTINEILNAKALPQRMRVLKYFIKMARFFKLFRNYNSMFAVISGLSHHAVSRLKETWDKLPGKYKRTFEQLERLLDPTRSHANYRALLRSEGTNAPMIPIYPFTRKDLAFIHLGNSTFVDGLVNFDKMRLVGREVRHLVAMTNMPYNSSAFEQHADVDASLLTISRAAVAPRGDSDELVPVAPSNNPSGTTNGTSGPNAANTAGANTLQADKDKDGATMRRKRTAQRGAAKRMYDEALSLRRVRAYLSTVQIVRDETRLTELSYAIEAGSKSLSNLSSVATPSSSKVSSNVDVASTPTATSQANVNANTGDITATVSSTNPSLTGKLPRKRFGADTVEAENKLLSLVDKTKPTNANKDKQSSSSHSKSNGFLAQFGMGRDRSSSSASTSNATTKSGTSTSATDSVDAPTQPRPSVTNSAVGVLSGLIKASKANHPTLSAESSSVSVPSARTQPIATPKDAPPPLHTVASQPSLTSHSKHSGMTHSVTSIGEQMDGTPRQVALDPNRPTMVHARKVSLSRVPPNSNQVQLVNEQQSPVNGSRTLPFGVLNHHFASTPSDTDSGRFSLSSASSSARLPSTEQQFANMQLNSHATPLSSSHGPSQPVSNNIRYAPPNNSSPVPAPNWQRAYANNVASPYTNASSPAQNATPRYPMHQNSVAQSCAVHSNSQFIHVPNSQQPQPVYNNHAIGTPGGQPFGPTDQIRVQQYVQSPNMPAILRNPRPNAPPDYNAAVNAKRNQLADRVMPAGNVLASRLPHPDYPPSLVNSAQQYAPMGANLQYPVRKLSQSSSLQQCANSLSVNDDDEQVSAV